MAITKEKKKDILSRLKDVFAEGSSVVFVNFHGLSVSNATELRDKLAQENVGYLVAKKTLIKKAIADSNIPGEVPVLEGETAVAWGEDPLAPARELYTFGKAHGGLLPIMGGVYDGSLVDSGHMMEIATIPPPQILRGMFVNLINSPIQRMVIALDQIAQSKH